MRGEDPNYRAAAGKNRICSAFRNHFGLWACHLGKEAIETCDLYRNALVESACNSCFLNRISSACAPDQVTACCGDSRHCKPGDLFAAILGCDRDGHDFAGEAVKRGASAILAERPLPVGVPTCIVDDSRTAYGRVCQALAGDPSNDMSVIGITGSHGKTTTALLLAAILEAESRSVGLLTSLGYCDGHDVITDVEATPPSPQLARWLASSQQNGCHHAVVEASSVGLAEHRLAGVTLDAAVMTNIRRAHLDLHGSVMNYRRIKQRILSHLKPDGFVVANADDPASKFFLSNVKHPLITFGVQSDAEITAELLEMLPDEQTILLSAGSETVPVRTRIIGQQHIYNCLAAAATGLVLGIDLTTVVRGIESLKHIPGRMELLPADVPFHTYVDQGQTADTLAAALKSLRRVTAGA